MTFSPGNVGFYKKSVISAGDVPEEVGFRTKAKYPEKLLVWRTIYEKGISEPFFSPNKSSLTGSMFREDCVKQRLVPFLEENHADRNYFIWSNLAS